MSPSRLLDNLNVFCVGETEIEHLRGVLLDLAIRGRFSTEADRAEIWPRQRLEDLATTITKGTTPTTLGFPFVADGIRFVKVENVKRGRIVTEAIKDFITKETHTVLSRSVLQEGDVLFSIAGTIGETCVVRASDLPANTNQALAIVRVPPGVLWPDYLRRQLDSFVAQSVRSKARGGAMNNVSLGDLRELVVVVPPLAEQKRIVEKVDQLMALCDDLEAKQTKKRDLATKSTRSALTALTTAETPPELSVAWRRVEEGFGSFVASAADIPAVREAVLALAVRGQFQQSGKQNVEREVRSDNSTFALPVGWSWRTVDSVTQLVTDGEHLTPPRIASGIPLVTAKNVRAGFMDLTTTDWVSREVAQKCWQRCAPKKGDILMVCVGATTGRVCVLGDTEPFVLVRSVALLRTDESQTTAAWLALFLRSPEGQRQIWANVKEQAQPCLYLNRMKGMSLPVPPLADQRRIVTTVDHLMSLLDDLEAKLRSQEETATRLAESLASAVAA